MVENCCLSVIRLHLCCIHQELSLQLWVFVSMQTRPQRRNAVVTKCGRIVLLCLIISYAVQLSPHPRHQRAQRLFISFEAGSLENSTCLNIGVREIQRIGVYDEINFNDSTHRRSAWKAGHFQFDRCDFSDIASTSPSPAQRTKVANGNLAVLTTMDANYVDILPSWVISVRNASAYCYVFTFDVDICEKVEALYCSCMVFYEADSNVSASANVSSSATGWHPRRVASVKYRFLAASILLKRGFDVIMHDADAILSPPSITQLAAQVTNVKATLPEIQLVVQDAGSRKSNFDTVNWGFAWIRSSGKNIDTFKCLLQRWDDPAFGCINYRTECSEYYFRSQPRINHLLEISIASGRDPNLCLIRDGHMKNIGVHHMTGYNSALMKKTCAKAHGALSDLTYAEITFSYTVPKNSTPSEQRKALQVSLFLAIKFNRKVQIPEAYFKSERVDFCLLFDLYQESDLHSRLTTRLRGENYDSAPFSIFEQPDNSKRHLFVDFRMLVEHSLSDSDKVFHIPICNPRNHAYRGLHMCQRKNQRDEI